MGKQNRCMQCGCSTDWGEYVCDDCRRETAEQAQHDAAVEIEQESLAARPA